MRAPAAGRARAARPLNAAPGGWRARRGTAPALLAALALLAACDGRRTRRERSAPSTPVAHVHLGEWFTSGAGRCQVSGADQLLTESATLPFPGARVKPDVPAVDLSLICENSLGAPARSREVLPLDALALLRDADGRKVAPRSTEDGREPDDEARGAAREPAARARDHLVFELPDGASRGIAAPRRFDAATGAPSVARESGASALEIRAPSLAVDVLLRPRFYGASFDAFLDALARGLARGGAPAELAAGAEGADALRALSALYAEVQDQFQAARFELVSAAPVAPALAAEAALRSADAGQKPEELMAVFVLNGPRRGASRGEIARFALRLARDARGQWRVADFENREAARRLLDCAALDANLESQLARAHAAGARRERRGESCNALGLLVPGSCARADPELLERALSVRARCHIPPDVPRAPAVPADFQLSLRRGRPERGLDRHPRYLLTLFPNGQVVFHGRHWVSTQERSDGRTTRALVAGLYARVLALDWFGRRGGAAARACAQGEQGDLISVRANARERTVIDREGCREPFSEIELSELKRRLELIAGVQGWTAPRPGYADDKVEHWTLAESAAEPDATDHR